MPGNMSCTALSAVQNVTVTTTLLYVGVVAHGPPILWKYMPR